MAHNPHRGTAGHTIATSILSKEGQDNSKDPDSQSAGQLVSGFSHMSVRPSSNGGFAVTHTPMPKGESGHSQIGHPETPTEEQLHVFRDATEAHNHIGQLLGVRMASGQQQT